MSRKDYNILAAKIDGLRGTMPEEYRKMCAEAIMSACKDDNPRFKDDMFMKACGFDTINK